MNNQEQATTTELFIQNVMSVLNEYSKDCIKHQMLRRAKAGYALQRPPVGYSKTQTSGLFKINRKGRALSQVMKKLANGDISVEIFRLEVFFILHSDKRGYRTKTELIKLVSNPYYSGNIYWKSEQFRGLHEPLITEAEQKQLKELL